MNKNNLAEYRQLAEELRYVQNQIERWLSLAERSTRPPSRAPALCGVHDPMPEIVDKLTFLREEAGRLSVRMDNVKLRLEQVFTKRLPELQRRVMRARYIDGQDWLTIAIDMNYSEAYLYKLHEKALVSLKYLHGKVRTSRKSVPPKPDSAA